MKMKELMGSRKSLISQKNHNRMPLALEDNKILEEMKEELKSEETYLRKCKVNIQ
jgi:hypothetical protein